MTRMEQHQCPVTANTLVEVNVAHRIDNCEVAAFSEEIKIYVSSFLFGWSKGCSLRGLQFT